MHAQRNIHGKKIWCLREKKKIVQIVNICLDTVWLTATAFVAIADVVDTLVPFCLAARLSIALCS